MWHALIVAAFLSLVMESSGIAATYWRLELTEGNLSGWEDYFSEIMFLDGSSAVYPGTFTSNRENGPLPKLNDGDTVAYDKWPSATSAYPAVGDYFQFVCSPACAPASIEIHQFPYSSGNRAHRMKLIYSLDSGATWNDDWSDFDTDAEVTTFVIPVILPTSQPSSHPSGLPSTQPSSQPSGQPSTQLFTLPSILASPTYKVRNGFAFAVTTSSGRGISWGEAAYGGNSAAVSTLLQNDVAQIVPARFAFVALKSNAAAVHWGVNASYVGVDEMRELASSPTGLVATEGAFAGVNTVTGGIVAFGSKGLGGDVSAYAVQLSSNVKSFAASAGAFAAIKIDGSVFCWGNQHAGANAASGFLTAITGAVIVVATRTAFAVLLSNSHVVSWGDRLFGGDSTAVSAQLRDVHHLIASQTCFVAFKRTTGIAVWGYGKHGGDTSEVAAALSANVIQVAFTFTAMAALKEDGSVVTWGEAENGGDSSAVQSQLSDIVSLHGNGNAFAALTSTGGVVTWGKSTYGGEIPADKVTALSSDVVSIYHTDRAFAALKNVGTVVVWGAAGHGGNPGAEVENLLTTVHTICANDVAFSAIRTDGKVVAWGHTVSVPTAGVQFTSNLLIVPPTCA